MNRPAIVAGAIACAAIGPGGHLSAVLHHTTSPQSAHTRAVETFFADLHRRGLFDGAVVVSDASGIVFEKGFGFANVERHVPFTPDTPADGASLAKTFTAALVLGLQRDGRLDLDTPARQLLPELPYPDVTLRHLLSHTSGIPVADYDFFNAYLPADQIRTTEKLLRVLAEKKPSPRSPPGTSFEYSSFGYDLAALAAARVGGTPYFDQLRERFLGRLGITSAFARPGRFSQFPGIRTLAYRHTGGIARLNDVFDYEAFHGGSNIYISARDLDKWNRAFFETATPGGAAALEFARVGAAPSGLTLGSWYRTPDGGAFWYSGHLQGFHNEVFRDLNARQSIVYMSNNTIEPWLQKGIVRSVRTILAGGASPPVTPPPIAEAPVARRSSFSGTWMLADRTVTIHNTAGRLYLSRDGVRYPVFPEGRRFFYVPGLDYILGFADAANGRPERLYVSTAVAEQAVARTSAPPGNVSMTVDTPMPAPRWALLERQLLADNVPACTEFFKKYFDDRGYIQCFVRWGANDGPDDAFENFNRWPELHALGAADGILRMYTTGHEGLLKQYAAAKTVEVPIARQGMYHKEFIVQSDWMHHGEGLQLFNRMGLSMPGDVAYQRRARRFAGFYMGEDPDAPNYDPVHKIIRSMQNGSRGPLLRQATPIDWVGDPFDLTKFTALHGESTFQQFLAHYAEYGDVVGDHFLNLVATTLPLDAYLLGNEPKYKDWIVDYMDAWLARMVQNGGVIPSFVDLDGKVGGPDGKWWKNAYGWGFSPVNPVTGRREDRNRIPRALVGFNNALLVTGAQKYVDAWRTMMDAVNSHAREVDGRKQYPTMHGADGWYGWRDTPWNVGALELWYWSQRPADRDRIGRNAWVDFLAGRNPAYPEQALKRDADALVQRVVAIRRDRSTPDTRLADNMLDYNPAATDAMVQLMWGALVPGREGGLLNARLRYFDPGGRRAGLPEDVAALVSELSDTRTVVTLVNVSPSRSRTVIVQGGGYGEHQILDVTAGGSTTRVDSPLLTVRLNPGCGTRLVLEMKRYANAPTVKHPWQR